MNFTGEWFCEKTNEQIMLTYAESDEYYLAYNFKDGNYLEEERVGIYLSTPCAKLISKKFSNQMIEIIRENCISIDGNIYQRKQ
jgi:tRNA(His) 5'-end guanylyltransferase